MMIHVADAPVRVLNFLAAIAAGFTATKSKDGGSIWLEKIDPSTGSGPAGYFGDDRFSFAESWAAGGPLVDLEDIELCDADGHHESAKHMAVIRNNVFGFGQTKLVAAMRCYIISKLGNAVEVPEDLRLLVDSECRAAAASGPTHAQPPSAVVAHDPGCICRGNWRSIVKESEPLIGRKFTSGGETFTYFGPVDGGSDYYYGMRSSSGKLMLLSCVGSIEGHGYALAP